MKRENIRYEMIRRIKETRTTIEIPSKCITSDLGFQLKKKTLPFYIRQETKQMIIDSKANEMKCASYEDGISEIAFS